MAPKKDPKKGDEPPPKYKGVYQNQGYWRARIWNKDTEVYLGHFADAEQAAAAYDKAAIRLRGLKAALHDLLNLDERTYMDDADAILEVPFEQLVLNLRASGVQGVSPGLTSPPKAQ
mmetsp:Transcript_18996/g.48769  ORF Transcript_18996/g.48769 Transcript_18996/m.48769 type:complete len:117 (+) Transcript_18996:78-428(+)|eukprot:jgi/Tetstr1/437765/TSEL_026419.t1